MSSVWANICHAIHWKAPKNPLKQSCLSHLNIRRKVHINIIRNLIFSLKLFRLRSFWNTIHSARAINFASSSFLHSPFAHFYNFFVFAKNRESWQPHHHRKLQVNGRSVLNFHKTFVWEIKDAPRADVTIWFYSVCSLVI